MRKPPKVRGTKQGKSFIRISLNDGSYALVDKQDYEKVKSLKWAKSSTGYARTTIYNPKRKKSDHVYMHRLVNNTPPRYETDHINGNRLDNRAQNLRSVTVSQNQLNRNALSGVYRNGTYQNGDARYGAAIQINRKTIFLGYYRTYEEALGARITAEECLVW